MAELDEAETRLRIVLGDQTVELERGQQALIGRDPAADIRSEKPYVSRRHAIVRDGPEGWLLEDAGSSRGIYHQGRRIELVAILGPTVVQLGDEDGGETLRLLPLPPRGEPSEAPGGRLVERHQPATVAAAPANAVALTVVSGPAAGRRVESRGSPLVIGRDPGCDLILEGDEVSRRHARIVLETGGRAWVEDLGSRNGTTLNGQVVLGRAELSSGSRIEIGGHGLEVEGAAGRLPTPAARPVGMQSGVTSVVARLERELDSVRRGQRSRRPLILGASIGLAVAAIALVLAIVLLRSPTSDEVVARLEPSVVRVAATGSGTGTGWVYDAAQGLIVTNHHVIESADGWTVLFNGATQPASLVGSSPCDDLAVLRIADAEGMRSADLGRQEPLRRGQTVLAIGFPTTLSGAGDLVATQGIVSVPRTTLPGAGHMPNVIQVDAAINPGNSGGPLVDINGAVIGVNTIKASGGGIEAQGYAIGIDHARAVIAELAGDRYIAWTGLVFDDGGPITLGDDGALLVLGAHPGTPADQAGMGSPGANESDNRYWLLSHIDGRPLGQEAPLDEYCTAALEAQSAGRQLPVTVRPVGMEGDSIMSRGEQRNVSLGFAGP